MSEPFLGELRLVPYNFAPRGWMFCDGQVLPIAQNTALFALLGTTYGGDGRVTFALPDLRGRVPIHVGGSGPGPGLSAYNLGQTGGEEAHVLTVAELPNHSHGVRAAPVEASTRYPNGRALARAQTYAEDTPVAGLHGETLSRTGGGQPHGNVQPYLALNWIIAVEGIFPSRS